MANIVKATGSRQGQAASNLYRLAALDQLAYCNTSNTMARVCGNCIFRDITDGNNAVPGELGYGSSTAAYQAGVGYDLATGLGSVDVSNLIGFWTYVPPPVPQIRIGIESASSFNSSVIGLTTFFGLGAC
jgi:hypothetical protein